MSEPIARFCSYFPHVNEHIKKREKKLLDFDAQRAKVQKLIHKSPSDDPTKLPRVRWFFNNIMFCFFFLIIL